MTTTATAMSQVRHRGLAQMLQDRRRAMQSEVQSRIRHARTDGRNEVLDESEHSEADIQDDIEFALIQMKAETVGHIDAALVRLEAGEYRLLLRVPQRDRGTAPAGPAVCRPVHGLRGPARARRSTGAASCRIRARRGDALVGSGWSLSKRATARS